MLPLIGTRHDKLALRLDDLASALEAGLPADGLLAPGPASGSMVQRLCGEGWPLSPAEAAALAAAEAAGSLPQALRSTAEARRARAQLHKDLMARMAYPCLVLGLAIPVASIAALTVTGNALLVATVVAVPLVVIGGAIALRRGLRRPGFTGAGVPGLQPILRDAAEIPYLEAMAAQYAAGIGVIEAHATALRAVPVAWVRARLFQAEQILANGQASLAEALAQTGAVGDETLQIVQPAEQTGELEEALRRALQRRRHTFRARTTRAAGLISGLAYGLVVLLVAWIAIDFYSGLYGRLRR